MEPKAVADCVLKVDVQCDECKMKLMEVLSSISGVYSVTIDAEQGIAKVAGEVEPNALLRALSRSGKHAKPVRVTFRDPRMTHYAYNNYDRYASPPPYTQQGYGNGYNSIEDSYARELPEHALRYDYPDTNYSGAYWPPTQYLPSVDEYNDAVSTSLCAIM